MNEDEQALNMREAIAFFKTAKIPMAMRLSHHEIILDTNKFIDTHISMLRHNWKNINLRLPPFERFMKAYEMIKTNTYEELDITVPIKTTEPPRTAKPKPQPKKSVARRKR